MVFFLFSLVECFSSFPIFVKRRKKKYENRTCLTCWTTWSFSTFCAAAIKIQIILEKDKNCVLLNVKYKYNFYKYGKNLYEDCNCIIDDRGSICKARKATYILIVCFVNRMNLKSIRCIISSFLLLHHISREV